MKIRYHVTYGDGGNEYVEVDTLNVNTGFHGVLYDLGVPGKGRELNRIEFWEVLTEPKYYIASVFGWMTIIEAQHLGQAVMFAKRRAPSASLLASDVNANNVREATKEEVAWYVAMGGEVT